MISNLMPELAKHHDKIAASLGSLEGFVLPMLTPSVVADRFLTFEVTLEDWHTACRRFDKHFSEWRSHLSRLRDRSTSIDEPLSMNLRFVKRWRTLGSDIRFDIRAFYTFSKIPFTSFFGVLFAMAGDNSSRWQYAGEAIKLLGKKDAPQVFNDFNAQFQPDLRWFEDHINLYRNKFVEHPFATSRRAIISSENGAKLSGLTGTGISSEDQSLITEIEAVAGDHFSALSARPLAERYFEICRKLEQIPRTHRRRVESMILRVGLESGELEPLAARLGEIFVGFVSFFAAWHNRTQPKRH